MTNSKNKDLSGLATPTTDLPPGWVEASIEEVLLPIRGISFPKEAKRYENDDGLIACLRTANVQDEVDWADLWFVSEEYLKRDEQVIEEGDILISISNSLNLLGKVAQVKTIPFKSTLGTFIANLRTPKPLNSRLIYYYLSSLKFKQDVRAEASTTTNISNISVGKLNKLPILIPPLAEQHRIVAKIEELFSDLDHSIAALEQSREQLKIYRQAVLKYAFEGKLTEGWRAARGQDPKGCGRETSGENLLGLIQAEREARTQQQLADWQAAVQAWESEGKPGRKPAKPQKPKDLPPLTEAELAELPGLPEGWVYNYLAYTGELARGKSKHRPRNDKILYGGDYPFIQTGEVKAANGVIRTYSQTYNEVGLSQSKLWPEGTLCITIAANIAETAFLGFDACFPDSIVGFSGFKDIVEPTYVDYFIQSVQQRIEAFAPATAQKNINLTILENLLIPFCPLEEQHAIVSEIEARLSVVDNLEQTIAAALQQADALRQSILKQAFAGKLVPQESADEPAAALLERIQNPKGF